MQEGIVSRIMDLIGSIGSLLNKKQIPDGCVCVCVHAYGLFLLPLFQWQPSESKQEPNGVASQLDRICVQQHQVFCNLRKQANVLGFSLLGAPLPLHRMEQGSFERRCLLRL